MQALIHWFVIATKVGTVLALPVLFIIFAVAGNDALHYYNIHLRNQGLPPLPTGVLSSRNSTQEVLFAQTPDDMSPTVRGYIRRYRKWTAAFFITLLSSLVLFHFF